jgi:hypothetical protein
MSLSPTQIAHGLAWESNPISAVTSHCLTASNMVQEKHREESSVTRKIFFKEPVTKVESQPTIHILPKL